MSLFDTDSWQEIAHTVRKNKLRTFLTACGVFWGIFMLLLMLGFGSGLEHGVRGNMGGFATNSAFVWGQRTSMPYGGMQPGREIEFRNADMEAIREIRGIRYLAPRNQVGGHRGGATVMHGSESGSYSVMGDYPAIRHVQPFELDSGRFLNPLDINERRKVAVIGAIVHEQLFERGEAAVGDHIKINGVYFQVVGVVRATQTGGRAERLEQTVFIPFTTFQQAFNYGDVVGWFAMVGEPGVSAETLEDRVRGVLRERHKIHPEDTQAIGSWNMSREFGRIQGLFLGIELFTWFVGVITLLAGVIGVSNIMLIVVKERTKEIGVRKALGATPASIVALVIQESIVLTCLAGFLGVVAGVGLLELISSSVGSGDGMLANPQVDFQVTLVAAAILVVSGALAGIIPAQHAARINPVEALRAEG